MKVTKLEKAIKEAVEEDVINAIQDVQLDKIINTEQINRWVQTAVIQHITLKIAETLNLKIMQELKKYDEQVDREIQRLVYEGVSKHIKI